MPLMEDLEYGGSMLSAMPGAAAGVIGDAARAGGRLYKRGAEGALGRFLGTDVDMEAIVDRMRQAGRDPSGALAQTGREAIAGAERSPGFQALNDAVSLGRYGMTPDKKMEILRNNLIPGQPKWDPVGGEEANEAAVRYGSNYLGSAMWGQNAAELGSGINYIMGGSSPEVYLKGLEAAELGGREHTADVNPFMSGPTQLQRNSMMMQR